VQDCFERRYGACDRSWEISKRACNDEHDAFEALVAGVATTRPGLLAWLAYFQELDSAFETEWMIIDRLFVPTCPSFNSRRVLLDQSRRDITARA
jgi:hypothetical protein